VGIIHQVVISPARRTYFRFQMNEHETESLLSVIVPTFNSGQTIRSCLKALTCQSTKFDIRIIVVDSSSDDTPQIVQREFPSVELIHLQERTFAGAARNIGARRASSKYCLMVDSDCVAAPNLIKEALNHAGGGEYDVVGGSLANGTPKSPSGWVSYLIEFKEFIPSSPLRLVTSVPTANALYLKKTLADSGYFDDDMWLAEDVLLNWRIHKTGGEILFDPALQVTHQNRTGWTNVLTYQIHLGRHSAIARRRGHLPGEILLRHPALVLMMPFVRTVNAFRWLAKYDRRALMILFLLAPMYLLAACFWSFGFLQEAASEMTR
jgi:GT2 family glycosyltransferase